MAAKVEVSVAGAAQYLFAEPEGGCRWKGPAFWAQSAEDVVITVVWMILDAILCTFSSLVSCVLLKLGDDDDDDNDVCVCV